MVSLGRRFCLVPAFRGRGIGAAVFARLRVVADGA
jgi:GNAT superfamily N-acetyltransferase